MVQKKETRGGNGTASGAAKARAKLSQIIKRGKELANQDDGDDEIEITDQDLADLYPESEPEPSEPESESDPEEVPIVKPKKEPKKEPKMIDEPKFSQPNELNELKESMKAMKEMMANMVKARESKPEPVPVVRKKTYREQQEDALRAKLLASFY